MVTFHSYVKLPEGNDGIMYGYHSNLPRPLIKNNTVSLRGQLSGRPGKRQVARTRMRPPLISTRRYTTPHPWFVSPHRWSFWRFKSPSNVGYIISLSTYPDINDMHSILFLIYIYIYIIYIYIMVYIYIWIVWIFWILLYCLDTNIFMIWCLSFMIHILWYIIYHDINEYY